MAFIEKREQKREGNLPVNWRRWQDKADIERIRRIAATSDLEVDITKCRGCCRLANRFMPCIYCGRRRPMTLIMTAYADTTTALDTFIEEARRTMPTLHASSFLSDREFESVSCILHVDDEDELELRTVADGFGVELEDL